MHQRIPSRVAKARREQAKHARRMEKLERRHGRHSGQSCVRVDRLREGDGHRRACRAIQARPRGGDGLRRQAKQEERLAALAAVSAFNVAAAVPLWERFSPLHPRATDAVSQAVSLPSSPLMSLRRGSDMSAAGRRSAMRRSSIPPAGRKRKVDDLPRPELHWSKSSGGW